MMAAQLKNLLIIAPSPTANLGQDLHPPSSVLQLFGVPKSAPESMHRRPIGIARRPRGCGIPGACYIRNPPEAVLDLQQSGRKTHEYRNFPRRRAPTIFAKKAVRRRPYAPYFRTQTPNVPSPIWHLLPGPHSIPNEQVFPAVRLGSNGSL